MWKPSISFLSDDVFYLLSTHIQFTTISCNLTVAYFDETLLDVVNDSIQFDSIQFNSIQFTLT